MPHSKCMAHGRMPLLEGLIEGLIEGPPEGLLGLIRNEKRAGH
jgi:hypothetical protein